MSHVLGLNAKKDFAQITANVQALICSDQTVLAAGCPVAGEPQIKKGGIIDRPIAHFPEDKPEPKNCQLWAFWAGDGKKQYGLNIGVAPVFDSLAAARGRLYLTTQEGKVICFGRE